MHAVESNLDERSDSSFWNRSTGRKGSELMIERIVPTEDVLGLTEADWRDDPESIAVWEAGVRSIEPPLIF